MRKIPKYWDLYLASLSLAYIVIYTNLANYSLTASPEKAKQLANSAIELLSSPQLVASIYLPFALLATVFIFAGVFQGKRYFISAALWIGLIFMILAAESFLAHTALSFDNYGPNIDYLVATVLALALSGASLSVAAALIWAQNSKT